MNERQPSRKALRELERSKYELKELLENGPLRNITRALHRDQKRKPKGREQDLKLAARHHNFTPLLTTIWLDSSSTVFLKGKKQIKREVQRIKKTDDRRAELSRKKRLARRLKTEDRSPEATQLRVEAKMLYHKAHRVSVSIDSTQAQNESARKNTEALRKILFINPNRETLDATFMGNLAAKDGQAVKRLTEFITGAGAQDMQLLFYGQKGQGLTNKDVHRLIHQGLREIPIVRISRLSGEVLLEITCAYPLWSAAHPGSLTNLDGSWIDGKINFYHRQSKLGKKQIALISSWWLKLNKS